MAKLIFLVFFSTFLPQALGVGGECENFSGKWMTVQGTPPFEFRNARNVKIEQVGCEELSVSDGSSLPPFKVSRELTKVSRVRFVKDLTGLNPAFTWSNLSAQIIRFEGASLTIAFSADLRTGKIVEASFPIRALVSVTYGPLPEFDKFNAKEDFLKLTVTKIEVTQKDDSDDWKFATIGANFILEFLSPFVRRVADSYGGKVVEPAKE